MAKRETYDQRVARMSPQEASAHRAWALEERRQTEMVIDEFIKEFIPTPLSNRLVERAAYRAHLDGENLYPKLPEEG